MSRVRVMIVDDASVMRLLIGKIIGGLPNTEIVATCENGQVALAQLAQARPDVIITDIEMPVMDGLTFLRQVRLRTKAAVVVLSSVAGIASTNADTARKLGANAVLCKPSGSTSLDLEEKLGKHLATIVRSLAPAA